MSKLLSMHLKRFSPFGLMAFAATTLLAPAAANATPYIAKLVQQGPNVVGTGSGAFDLTAFTFEDTDFLPFGDVAPIDGILILGDGSSGVDQYQYSTFSGGGGSISGPSNFGSGPEWETNSNVVGDVAGFDFAYNELTLPKGYLSGADLGVSTATWDNASFASLGITPGTYIWTWGPGAEQSYTLIIGGAVTAPEPAALGMFGFGVLLIGAFVGFRRRFA